MWTSNKMIAVYIAIGVAVAALIAWLVLKKTVRTRLRMEKTIRDDPDINDWLIIFDWTLKILYVPSIAAAVVAGLLMLLKENIGTFDFINPSVVGGVFLAIVFLNLLVEEYEISVKVLILAVIGIGFLLLWLHLLGWVVPFLKLFRHLGLSISATGYFLVALIALLVIFICWVKGLFYYVTITPNYMNLQQGPTESGEHIGREDYNTLVDTTDFLERLMGFGRIVIIFKDMKRPPMELLVWNIQKKSQLLEKVRGKFAIDAREQQSQMQQPPVQNQQQTPKREN
jgi:hypothetical protein